MKNNKLYIVIFTFMSIVILASCETDFDNPNAATAEETVFFSRRYSCGISRFAAAIFNHRGALGSRNSGNNNQGRWHYNYVPKYDRA